MKTILRLFIVAVAIGCGQVQNLHAQLPPAFTSRLQTVLDSMCNKYHVKGASAAIYVPGRGLWKGVHGESYAGNPVTDKMAFALNSNTKTYTAAVMLLLQEQGALQLSDTIGKWIHNKTNINGQITIRQLLNHTSGLYSYTDSAAFADSLEANFARVWQPAEMLQFVGPPVFSPGAGWAYSNTNYLLAGMIIAQVTGMPVEQAIRTKVLTPAGLSNTWFYPQETPTLTIPHFWFFDGTSMIDGLTIGYSPESFYSASNSAGALFSTAEDNVIFWHKMIADQVINASSLSEWRQMVTLSSAIGYGLGVFRYKNFNGHTIYEHGGTGAGTINENLADSVTGVCISLLTNQDSADNSMLLNGVIKALHKVTNDPPTAVPGLTVIMPYMIYPNPVMDELHIERTERLLGTCTYTVIDATGKKVLNGKVSEPKTTVPTGGLQSGAYYLQLTDESGQRFTRSFSRCQ